MTTSYDSTPIELYREYSGERLLRALVAQPASTDLAWEAWCMLRFMLLDQIGEAKEQRKKLRSRKSEFYDCCSETEAKISHSVAGRLISRLHIVFDLRTTAFAGLAGIARASFPSEQMAGSHVCSPSKMSLTTLPPKPGAFSIRFSADT